MTAKIDFGSLFPSYEGSHKRMVRDAPMFMRCPGGHTLPHRTHWGRCCPVDCCDRGQYGTVDVDRNDAQSRTVRDSQRGYEDEMDILPMGLEGRAITQDQSHTVEEAEYAPMLAEWRKEILRDYAGKMAREAIHPMPELPKPPPMTNPREYVKTRLEQVAPYMLEAEIFDALYGSGDRRKDARQALLDRQGYTRKGEGAQSSQSGPVIMVQINNNPYAKQTEKANGKEESGNVRVVLQGSVRQPADAARGALPLGRGGAQVDDE